jgi:hypothetical protein
MNGVDIKHYPICLIDRVPEKFLPDIAASLEASIKKLLGTEEVEKAKQNAKYLAKLERSSQQLKEGKTIDFTIEELESFEEMPYEEMVAFAEKRRNGLV